MNFEHVSDVALLAVSWKYSPGTLVSVIFPPLNRVVRIPRSTHLSDATEMTRSSDGEQEQDFLLLVYTCIPDLHDALRNFVKCGPNLVADREENILHGRGLDVDEASLLRVSVARVRDGEEYSRRMVLRSSLGSGL